MNTLEIFKYIIYQANCHQRTGVDYATISLYRRWLEGATKGRKPTIEKMEEIIVRYGATVIQDKLWKLN